MARFTYSCEAVGVEARLSDVLTNCTEIFATSDRVADGMSPQLLRGWHGHDGDGLIWSKKNALVALANPRRKQRIRIAGTLPHAPVGETNSLTVTCNQRRIGGLRNESRSLAGFDMTLSLPEKWDSLYLEFSISHLFRPSLHSPSSDSRDLGVGLARVEVRD